MPESESEDAFQIPENLAALVGNGVGKVAPSFDQLAANLRDMAGMLGAFRESLVEYGFEQEDAVALVQQWAQSWWDAMHAQAFRSDDD